MQDDFISQQRVVPSRGRGGGQMLALALVIALVLGGTAAVWAGERLGWIDFTGKRSGSVASLVPAMGPAPARRLAAAAPPPANPAENAQAALGVRLAELELRITQLNLQAEAAGAGWAETRVAPTSKRLGPKHSGEAALLALARDMCQNALLPNHR